jgi:hypothetical protein
MSRRYFVGLGWLKIPSADYADLLETSEKADIWILQWRFRTTPARLGAESGMPADLLEGVPIFDG